MLFDHKLSPRMESSFKRIGIFMFSCKTLITPMDQKESSRKNR